MSVSDRIDQDTCQHTDGSVRHLQHVGFYDSSFLIRSLPLPVSERRFGVRRLVGALVGVAARREVDVAR